MRQDYFVSRRHRPRLPLLLLIVVIVLCWPRFKSLPETRAIITPVSAASSLPSPQTTNPIPAMTSDFLPRVGASAHAVTLVALGDGKVMAAWFAGSREGASDVAIFSSMYDKAHWSAPQSIVDRHNVRRDTQRLIRKLGNPLLWRDPQGVLHLWFVSASYGGWAGSAINHMQSNDDGVHWSPATRLVTSPFWNLSTLVRNPPIALANGEILLPAYHEFIFKQTEWLHIDREGRLVDKIRLPHGAGTLQPAAVALDEHRMVAMMRSNGLSQRIQTAHSDDAGSRWQGPRATVIANPDSALAMIRLADGSLLLACNPLEANRNRLALLRSTDEGEHWSAPFIVEQGSENDEFSYPALLLDETGVVHLAYTWKRQGIKHITLPFNVIAELH